MERGCSELEGTLTAPLQQVVKSCRQCHLVWCTLCQQEKGECDACSVPIALTTNLGAGGAKYRGERTQRLQAKGMKGAKVVSVNMHRVGGELC